jgi:hypothetical protein
MDAQSMIQAILEYACEHPEFDTTFVESLQERIDGGRELTYGQYSALERIVDSFRIEV